MGQGKSAIIDSKLYNAEEYETIQSFNDERYGQMKLLANKTTQQKYAEIFKTLNDESVLEKRVEELNFRSQLEHANLIKLVSFNSQKKDEFCSSFYKIGLFYEYFNNNLRTEIKERQKVRAAYREGEVWYVLDSLLNVVFYLKEKNVNHGDIRPYNVVITQEGQAKLGEVFTHSQPLSSYSQLLGNTLEELYISPQLFRSLKEYKATPIYDASKSDIYSIGMTVLEMATLEDVSRVCYDKENFVIRQDEVNRLLNQVRTQYSFNLYNFIQKLLVEGEQERSSVEELLIERNTSQDKYSKLNCISTIDILGSQTQTVQGGTIAETTYVQEEHVLRSSNPAKQSNTYEVPVSTYVPEYTSSYQAPVVDYTATYQAPVETTNYQNDDLNARIQAVLAMSRETIAKYGTSNGNYTSTPATYTTTTVTSSTPAYVAPTYSTPATYTTPAVPVSTYSTYTTNYNNVPIDAKASQIESRTYLNDNTNNIETKSYYAQEPIEEVIKRSKRETEVPAQAATFTNNYDPVRASQQYNISSSYTPVNTNYTFTNTNANANANVNYNPEVNYNSTYVPYTSKVQETYTSVPTSTVNQQVSQSTMSFKTAEERDAYIQKLLADAKQTYNPSSNSNTQITYTTYVDGKPSEQMTSYNGGNYQAVINQQTF